MKANEHDRHTEKDRELGGLKITNKMSKHIYIYIILGKLLLVNSKPQCTNLTE